MKLTNTIIALAVAMVPMSAVGQQAERAKRPFVDERQDMSYLDEKVIVGKDTVNLVIPERNFGRYDRGLFNFLYIPKGEWAFGLTANYGSFDSEDSQALSVIKDFDFDGRVYSIKPSVAYFFANNQSIGLKLNYTKWYANLPSLSMDFGDDLNFDIKGVKYESHTVSAAVFYRKYVGLSRAGRWAVFNDVDLAFGGGSSRFLRYYGGEPRDTRTNIFQASLDFSPGVCVYIVDHVSFDVSFGVFGVYFRKESQRTNGEDEGSRFASGANFRFNIFNINFGIGIHI